MKLFDFYAIFNNKNKSFILALLKKTNKNIIASYIKDAFNIKYTLKTLIRKYKKAELINFLLMQYNI